MKKYLLVAISVSTFLFFSACTNSATLLEESTSPSPTISQEQTPKLPVVQNVAAEVITVTTSPIPATRTPSTLTPVFDDKEILFQFDTTEKYVVLTIDDGFSDLTLNRMLDLLEEADSKASFFLVGSAVKDSLKFETLKRIIDDGNDIAYHSLNHPDLSVIQYMSYEDWTLDYQEWQTILREKLGDMLYTKGVMPYSRVPYGEWTASFLTHSLDHHLTPVNWTCNRFAFEKGRVPIRAGGILILHVEPDDVHVLEQLLDLDWQVISLRQAFEGLP